MKFLLLFLSFLLYKEGLDAVVVVDGGNDDDDDEDVEEVGLAPFDNKELLRWNVAVIFVSFRFLLVAVSVVCFNQ